MEIDSLDFNIHMGKYGIYKVLFLFSTINK